MAVSEPIVTGEESELVRRVGMMWQEMSHHEQQTSFVDRQIKWITKLCENARAKNTRGVGADSTLIRFIYDLPLPRWEYTRPRQQKLAI